MAAGLASLLRLDQRGFSFVSHPRINHSKNLLMKPYTVTVSKVCQSDDSKGWKRKRERQINVIKYRIHRKTLQRIHLEIIVSSTPIDCMERDNEGDSRYLQLPPIDTFQLADERVTQALTLTSSLKYSAPHFFLRLFGFSLATSC